MKPDMTPAKPAERVVLAIIVILYICAGVVYSVSTPFLDVSDEVRHYAMVEQLAQGLGLPKQDPAHHGFYEQEGSQPPLYYAIMAIIALPFDRADFMQLAQFNPHALLGRADATNNFNQVIHTAAENFPWHGTVLVVHVLRLLGILMGAVTVLCAYGIARGLVTSADAVSPRASPAQSMIPLVAAALTAFNPMFVFIMASVNNDTLATMLGSLGLLLALRIITHRLTWRNAAVLGLVMGAAALSKSSALALVGVIPPAIFVSEWLRLRSQTTTTSRRRGDAEREKGRTGGEAKGVITAIRVALPPLLLMVAIVAVTAGWWYARNAILYNGDFTGTTMMAVIAGPRDRLPTVLELINEWDGFRKAYLGLFGAVNIPMAEWTYHAFDAVLVLAGVGLLTNGIRDWVSRKREREHGLTIGALMCFGAFVIAFAALIRWTSITLASQGRLLFPVIAVISTFIALGLGRLASVPLRRAMNAVVIALCGGLAVLTLASPWLYIRPAYITPTLLQNETQLPANMVKTELRFEDAIRWIGYKVETPRARPGEEFIVTLYWQGLKPMTANYSAFIRLYGRGDTQVVLLDTYPGGGMWQTSRWQPGEIIADRYRLRIPDTVTNTQLMPTALWLDAGYWNFDTREFLQTYDGNGNQTGRQRYEAGALASIQPTTTASAPAQPRLAGATAAITAMKQAGSKLAVTVNWTATFDFGEDYTVFMHLFNNKGEKVAQADGRAAGGTFSARWWRRGDQVEDTHVFDLPAELPPGEYTIKYGLYKPTDGARMPGFDASGQPIGDAALAQTVTILPR